MTEYQFSAVVLVWESHMSIPDINLKAEGRDSVPLPHHKMARGKSTESLNGMLHQIARLWE